MAMQHIYRPPLSLYDSSRALWRSGAAIKANPPRGGGAKPMGLSSSRERQPGCRTVVGSRCTEPQGESLTTQHSERGRALSCVCTLHASLFWADGVDD